MKNEFELRDDGDFSQSPTFTLYDEGAGREVKFGLLARTVYLDKLYYALSPLADADSYMIVSVTEDGEDILFEEIEDDAVFEELVNIFDELLSDEMDYDA